MRDYDVLTHEYREELLDLIHEGYLCAVNDKGQVIGNVGNDEALVYYRSASKPLQAIPVIMNGLHTKYGLTDEEIVIFSGSHLGEEFHIRILESIFKKAGLNEEDLVMKPGTPGLACANEERIKKGLPERKLYHNCSGKHAALMLLQRELGGKIKDYWKTDSLAQLEVKRVIAQLSDFPVDKIITGIDGCGVPVFAVPMKNIAISFNNLACLDTIKDEKIKEAAAFYVPLINKYPLMMRGTGYICSLINYDTNIVAKGGASGVYGLALKKERIGISLKLKDGTESMWPIIIKEALIQLGYKNKDTLNMLEKLHTGTIVNDNGTSVGYCKPVFKL